MPQRYAGRVQRNSEDSQRAHRVLAHVNADTHGDADDLPVHDFLSVTPVRPIDAAATAHSQGPRAARATSCEDAYNICGGQVDYGDAPAAEYGHQRFERSYVGDN